MCKFDPHYDAEMKEFIISEYNKKKFIDGYMAYVIYDNYK